MAVENVTDAAAELSTLGRGGERRRGLLSRCLGYFLGMQGNARASETTNQLRDRSFSVRRGLGPMIVAGSEGHQSLSG